MGFESLVHSDPILGDSSRGPSGSIWATCPWDKAFCDPGLGLGDHEDFNQFPSAGAAVTVTNIGKWRRFGDTGSTITDAAIAGGGITFTCANADESQSLNSLVAPYKIASGQGKLFFEARIKTSSIAATTCNVFVGLMDSEVCTQAIPITTTDDLMADINFIGFIVKSTGVVGFRYKADGQTVQNPIATVTTLTADTFVKLGFVFDPDAPASERIKVYLNGVQNNTFVTQTQIDAVTFPNDVFLGPVLAHTNMATKGTSSYDFVRHFQKSA